MTMLVAYLHNPLWKAMVLMVPIPFTVAVLSVGKPISSCNIMSLVLLLSFTHMVRIFHYTFRWQIVPSIITSACAYCLGGMVIACFLPDTQIAFWAAFVATVSIALLAFRLTPPVNEKGHRSPLPLYIKIPIVFAVVVGLVTLKGQLQGFMPMFPMVGVLAAYEARHSLWTVCRQINIGILMFLVMMMVIYLTQNSGGLIIGLGFGWCVYMMMLIPYFIKVMKIPLPFQWSALMSR